jgi:imidazolonepropionase
MSILISNIKELVQIENMPRKWVAGSDMAEIKSIKEAWLLTEGHLIKDFGHMQEMPDNLLYDEHINAHGRMVFPSFVDSHTHLVYPASREIEYIDKIKGLSYEEIAKRGGGILNTAKKMVDVSEDYLVEQALIRINTIAEYGTGAVEIKSGYGLSTASEIKMLRAIGRLKELSPIQIKATFLGAHALPPAYKGQQSKYVDLVINEMLPLVAEEGLADYVDVFCDKGFFSVEETDRILDAAAKYNLIPKIHANELDYSGGIQVGVKHGALSVDHLEFTGEEEINALKTSATMPTILPGAAFFLNMRYAPARKIMNAGLPVALASDFNPGSAPSGNMQLIMSMGSILYKMTPEEVINATTINTAYAMGLANEMGGICKGKRANFYITKEIPSYAYMPYSFGDNKVDRVILNGEIWK